MVSKIITNVLSYFKSQDFRYSRIFWLVLAGISAIFTLAAKVYLDPRDDYFEPSFLYKLGGFLYYTLLYTLFLGFFLLVFIGIPLFIFSLAQRKSKKNLLIKKNVLTAFLIAPILILLLLVIGKSFYSFRIRKNTEKIKLSEVQFQELDTNQNGKKDTFKINVLIDSDIDKTITVFGGIEGCLYSNHDKITCRTSIGFTKENIVEIKPGRNAFALSFNIEKNTPARLLENSGRQKLHFVAIGTDAPIVEYWYDFPQNINFEEYEKADESKGLVYNTINNSTNDNFIFYNMPESYAKKCELSNTNTQGSEEYKTINFPGKIVGLGQIQNSDQKQDRIYILDLETCDLKKIANSLTWRPVQSLKKKSNNTFSFVITAQPHYGHFYEYDLNGTELKHIYLLN